MVNDPVDELLKSLATPSYLEHLETRGKIRRTGGFVRTGSGAVVPVHEVIQTPEEAARSWQ
jgi:hypothetical protein